MKKGNVSKGPKTENSSGDQFSIERKKTFFPVILKGRVFFYILTVVEHLPPHPKVKSSSQAYSGKENGGKKVL